MCFGVGVSGHNLISAKRVVMDIVLDTLRLGSGGRIGPNCLAGETTRASLFCIEKNPLQAGARGTKLGGGIWDTLRLLLGPSWFPPRVPSDVAGLGAAALVPLSLANDDFARATPEVGCAEGGRIPLPTLAEKVDIFVDVDVFLEAFELLRYDCEKEDGFRVLTADMTAEVTGALDFGAPDTELIGSPPRSASVFLFEGGSGTVACQYCSFSSAGHSPTVGSVPFVTHECRRWHCRT